MHAPQKIGLIAGQGSIPSSLVVRWEELGFIPVIAAVDCDVDDVCVRGRIHRYFSLGQAGAIIDFFRQHQVSDVVMVGAVQRPDFWRLRVDFQGFLIILNFLFAKVGDDKLLKVIRRALEGKGFSVRGVHEYLPELICPAGVLGAVVPDDADRASLRDGFKAAKLWSKRDEGQAVVISGGRIIAYENAQGTNALIGRSPDAARKILLKICKDGQDMHLDLPTIGVRTIQLAHARGFVGVALEAGAGLLVNRQEVINLCDRYGMFFVGVREGDFNDAA